MSIVYFESVGHLLNNYEPMDPLMSSFELFYERIYEGIHHTNLKPNG